MSAVTVLESKQDKSGVAAPSAVSAPAKASISDPKLKSTETAAVIAKPADVTLAPHSDAATVSAAFDTSLHLHKHRTRYEPAQQPSTLFSAAFGDVVYSKIEAAIKPGVCSCLCVFQRVYRR